MIQTTAKMMKEALKKVIIAEEYVKGQILETVEFQPKFFANLKAS